MISRSLGKVKKLLYRAVGEALDYASTVLSDFLEKIFAKELERYVIGSGISSSIYGYIGALSRLIIIASTASLISTLILTLLARMPPVQTLLFTSITSLLGVPGIIMLVGSVLPRILYRNRGSVVESKAIVLLLTLSFLSLSGSTIYEVLERLPKLLGDSYRFFSVELDRALTYLKAGKPLDEVFSELALITPSHSLRELFLSLSAFVKVGGDLSAVVERILGDYLSRYELIIERAVEGLGIYMELYIALALLMPVGVAVIAMLFLIYPMGALSFEAIIFLISLVLTPIMTAALTVLADLNASRLRP